MARPDCLQGSLDLLVLKMLPRRPEEESRWQFVTPAVGRVLRTV